MYISCKSTQHDNYRRKFEGETWVKFTQNTTERASVLPVRVLCIIGSRFYTLCKPNSTFRCDHMGACFAFCSFKVSVISVLIERMWNTNQDCLLLKHTHTPQTQSLTLQTIIQAACLEENENLEIIRRLVCVALSVFQWNTFHPGLLQPDMTQSQML